MGWSDASSAAEPRPVPYERRKILVADDNESILRLAERILIDEGYDVVLAADGETTLEAAEAERPDLIVLDLLMPSMNGFEVLREIRRRSTIGSIPVLAMSGVYKDNVIEMLHQLGANGFVDKDHLQESLLFRVHAILEDAVGELDPAGGIVAPERGAHSAHLLCDTCREERPGSVDSISLAHLAAAPAGRARARILVADDAETILRMVGRTLSEAGYDVLLSGDGQSALEIAERERPDIVILDLLLPKMTGFDVLREIKKSERIRAIPVLIMSGVYKENVVGLLHELGAVGFVDKENLFENLVFRVRSILREAASA